MRADVAFIGGLPKSQLSNLLAGLTVFLDLLAMGEISFINNKVMLADLAEQTRKVI